MLFRGISAVHLTIDPRAELPLKLSDVEGRVFIADASTAPIQDGRLELLP
jgi:hypothetical protein